MKDKDNDDITETVSVMLSGVKGSGKTALAAHIASLAEFPFTKVISPQDVIGMGESAKTMEIQKVFENAYKSRFSFIILDRIERLIDYAAVGPRYSNTAAQAIMELVNKPPKKKGHHLFVIGTTAESSFANQLGLSACFTMNEEMTLIREQTGVSHLLTNLIENQLVPHMSKGEINEIAKGLKMSRGVGVGNLINAIKEASSFSDLNVTNLDSYLTKIEFQKIHIQDLY
eukprot:Trichotokara_eunicae@DN7553_c0_g1_i1.p1